MSKHKHIQLPRFRINGDLFTAIEKVESFISTDIAAYKDGESIVIEYLNGNEQSAIEGFVTINGDIVKIYVSRGAVGPQGERGPQGTIGNRGVQGLRGDIGP